MTIQEKAEIISPARQYLDALIDDAPNSVSLIDVDLSKIRALDIKDATPQTRIKEISKLTVMRMYTSGIIDKTQGKLDKQLPRSQDDCKVVNQPLVDSLKDIVNIGYEDVAYLLSLELADLLLTESMSDAKERKIHIPSCHKMHQISRVHLLNHIKEMSNLTGNFHHTSPELDYSKAPELNPHPSCLIGSLGKVALIHHVTIPNVGSNLFITPYEQLAISA